MLDSFSIVTVSLRPKIKNKKLETEKMKIKLRYILAVLAIIGVSIILFNIRLIKYDDKIYITFLSSGVISKSEKLLSSKKVELISSKTNDTIKVDISDLGINFDISYKNSRLFDLNECSSFYIAEPTIFKDYFNNMNSTFEDSKDAYYEFTEDDIVFYKEKIGTKVDVDSLYETYVKNICNDVFLIDLSGFIIKPRVTIDYFDSTKTAVDKYKSCSIEYENGLVLDFDYLLNYLSIEGNELKLNSTKLRIDLQSFLKEKLSSFNTVGVSRKFKTTDGKIIAVSDGTYGDTVNIEEEIEYLINSIDACVVEVGRLPEYTVDLPDEFPNTYIEVSIDKQHLWYYVDGKLKMESDVVTGTKGKHDTPKGMYYISERIDGKYLTGDTYKTWVNQWMRLTNQGVGLHDAYWRGRFGGSIYKYNGSHGCINLPKSFAKELFNAVKWKTAVIIY